MSDIEKIVPEEGEAIIEGEMNLPPPDPPEDTPLQTDSDAAKKRATRRRAKKADAELQGQSGETDDADAIPEAAEVPAPEETGNNGESRTRSRRKTSSAKSDSGIVTIDAAPSVETEEDKARDAFIDLVESLKTGRYLTDTIQGVERPSPNMEPRLILFHGDFKVIILASEAIKLPPDLKDRDPFDAQYNMLNLRLGAQIDYVIKGIDGENKIAVASRFDAMRTRRRFNYLQETPDGTYRMYEGVCCEARVMAVIASGIFVEVFGVETFIPQIEISYTRTDNVIGSFYPGDRVLVKIIELNRDDPDHIRIRASIKRTAPDPRAKSLEKVVTHSNYAGEVTMLTEYGVFVALDIGVECLCKYPYRGRPPRGARVTVCVDGKDEELNQIWGSIIYSAVPH